MLDVASLNQRLPIYAVYLMVAASNDGTEPRDEPSSGINRRGNFRVDRAHTPDPASAESRGDEILDARKLLHSVPELSEERMAEIKERIKQGYYQRADVLQRIAKRLSDRLSSPE